MSKVTIQSIADACGLSKFAVSRALSGKEGVSEATRARVTEAATRLGYSRPTAMEKKPLGLIFNDADRINTELHMYIQEGAQREAQRLGYPVRVEWTDSPKALVTMAKGCAGMMICGPIQPATLKLIQDVGIPVVRQGWHDPLEPIDQVSGCDHEAGAAVGNYLVGLGHREIAYVHGAPHFRGRLERFYGLREALENHADTVLHDLHWENDDSFAAVFDRLLERGGRPTALFCSHDGLGLTVISELLARGIRIPEDASVVGFGDYSAAQQITPNLTTVKVPAVEVGMMGARLLDSRIAIADFPACPLRLLVPGQIVVRQSTGPNRMNEAQMPATDMPNAHRGPARTGGRRSTT